MTHLALWQSCIQKMPLIAILRGVSPDEVLSIGHCLVETGFTAIEVPLNSPEPLRSIEILANEFGDKVIIGAGTVLTGQNAKDVIAAGSQVVIAPNFSAEVARVAVDGNVVYCPGVATPTEALAALEHGAHALKLFPAELVSPTIVRAMNAILPDNTDLFAVGGINPDNMTDYVEAGVKGFGIGSALYKPGKTIRDIEISAGLFIKAMV